MDSCHLQIPVATVSSLKIEQWMPEKWWLVRMTKVWRKHIRATGICFPSISSPVLHGSQQGTFRSHQQHSSSHSRDSQKPVKRPGATSISRTSSLPLLQHPFAHPECTVSLPLPFSPLLGCMHCLYCTEKGRDSRSEVERGQAPHRLSQPQSHPHQPELAAFQEGWYLMGRVSAWCPWWSRCFWAGQPLICTPENRGIEFR